jgi:hypothetical protein
MSNTDPTKNLKTLAVLLIYTVKFGIVPYVASLRLSFLAHLAIVRRLSSVVRRPSVNISHFNLLLRNHWTNCDQTLVEWSLDGPLSKLCPVEKFQTVLYTIMNFCKKKYICLPKILFYYFSHLQTTRC